MKVRRETLRAVLPAISKDTTRYNLIGVLVKPDGTFVATDGHRLHMVKQDLPWVDEQAPVQLEEPAIVMGSGLKSVEKAMPKGRAIPEELRDVAELDVVETNRNGHARFVAGGAQFDVEKIDGEYPDFEQVLPKRDDGVTFGINAQYLKEACDAVLKFAPSSRSRACKITVKDELSPVRIEATNADTGDELTVVIMPMRL
jgi:DNA polymerase III sliding clamp (beta) subunit (PCNA family)